MAGEAVEGIFAVVMSLISIISLVIWVVAIGGIILWIIMLIDAIKRVYPNPNEKIIWILVILFTGYIGAIIYYFVVKRKDKKQVPKV
jgi:TctA family transporter